MKLKAVWDRKMNVYGATCHVLAKRYNRPAWYFYADVLLNKLINGVGPVVYFSWAMYRMNQMERAQFVAGPKSKKLERIFNTNPDRENIISNKNNFNRIFGEFVKRQWRYVPECNEEQIREFLSQNEKFILKPFDSAQGIGVKQYESAEVMKDLPGFIKLAKESNSIIEEFICQHPEMAALNPSSVNTIRVNTVRDRNGEVHVIAASLRVGGKSSVVDNFSAGGVQYPIDPRYGIVIGGGVTHDGGRDVFYHPSTSKQVLGFNIPHWDCVVETVKKAGTIPENIRYVGWDIAITEKGCEVVEGNIGQGVNGLQLDGIGKYRILLQYK